MFPSHRSYPTTAAEIARIQRTLIVYGPLEKEVEVWYHYPLGFPTVYSPGEHNAVYATDPSEVIPETYDRDPYPSYYARADRQLGAITLRDVGQFYEFLKEAPAQAILVLPNFVPPDDRAIATTIPAPEALKKGWVLYTPDQSGRFPLNSPPRLN